MNKLPQKLDVLQLGDLQYRPMEADVLAKSKQALLAKAAKVLISPQMWRYGVDITRQWKGPEQEAQKASLLEVPVVNWVEPESDDDDDDDWLSAFGQ